MYHSMLGQHLIWACWQTWHHNLELGAVTQAVVQEAGVWKYASCVNDLLLDTSFLLLQRYACH